MDKLLSLAGGPADSSTVTRSRREEEEEEEEFIRIQWIL